MKSKRLKLIIIFIVIALIISIAMYKSQLSKFITNDPNFYTNRELIKLSEKDSQIKAELDYLQYHHKTSLKNIELLNNDYFIEGDMIIPREYIQKLIKDMK